MDSNLPRSDYVFPPSHLDLPGYKWTIFQFFLLWVFVESFVVLSSVDEEAAIDWAYRAYYLFYFVFCV